MFQFTGINFRNAGREYHAFSLLDIHLKVAGNIKVLIEIITTFLLLGIFNTSIPVGLEMEFILLVQLHEQFRITGIHTGLDTIFHQLIIPTGLRILVRIFAHTAESQEGTETQCRGRMGIDKRITNQNTVLMMYKNLFLTEDNASHTVSCSRDVLAIKLTDVFMSVGTEVIALIFVQSQIKLCTVLNYRFVQRREQHMILIVQVGDRNHQQAVIFACVTIYNRCTMIGTRLICTEYLPGKRLFQINHQRLVKS